MKFGRLVVPKRRASSLAPLPYDEYQVMMECCVTPKIAPISPCSSDDSSSASASAASITGRIDDIEDRYRIDPQVLGEGYQGFVRRCVDRRTGRCYAIKTIRRSTPGVTPERLAREMALLGDMRHPGIVKLVSAFEDSERVHLVTDLCEGGELFDRIVARAAGGGADGAACFAEDEAAGIIRQILSAVSYMHGRGVVHRDIKPENVLFETAEENSRLKIIDFGMARMHDGGKEPPMTVVVGTPYYIAPEVLRQQYDNACDLWSVGVIAYVLLCGYPPFNGADRDETHRLVLRGQYCFPSEEWDSVSSEARDFICQLLQMDPKKRMTADEALSHPWIATHFDSESSVTDDEWLDCAMDEDQWLEGMSVDYVHVFKGIRLPTKSSVVRNGKVKRKIRKFFMR